MTYQTKLRELKKEIISKLTTIIDRPEGWLPHIVFVEDENADCAEVGAPVYNQYKLLDFLPDGECQLLNVITNEEEVGALCEIEIDWLAMVLNYYCELIKNHIAINTPKELRAFVFPIDLERNISDEELINLWEQDDSDITIYTPDEFAALLNDEAFDEANNYVRFINI